MLKRLLNIIFLISLGLPAMAQEFNCKVMIMHDKISGVDAKVFLAMQSAITDFMNSRKWTNDDFGANEKIECNIMFNLVARIDADGFTATMTIQASRPVFNSGYSSPIVNYVDKDVAFHFSQYVPLQFDDNRVSGTDPLASNLPALLAYYSYMILGLDYDSFAPLGGTAYFKKVQNVVSNAPEQGGNILGWKAVENNRNRFWLIDQLLNTRFEDLRKYWYTLHREGLDNMYTKPVESRAKALSGIIKLSQVNKENPGSILLQFFFNAKSDELMRMVAQLPGPSEKAPLINMLSQMDVANATKYGQLK